MATFNQQGQNIVGGTQINVGSSVWNDGNEIPKKDKEMISQTHWGENILTIYKKGEFFDVIHQYGLRRVKRWMYIPE